MSQRLSPFLHPFDVARHPSLHPEAKRAILTSWASDRAAVEGQPSLRNPPGMRRPIPVDDIFEALRSIDRQERSGEASRQ